MVTSEDVLITLRIRGASSEPALSSATGAKLHDLTRLLIALESEGLIRPSTLGVGLWDLKGDGELRVSVLLRQLSSEQVAGLANAYAGFKVLNPQIKLLCTQWQLRAGSSETTIRDRLAVITTQIIPVFHQAAAAVRRFDRYSERLTLAANRFIAGDDRFLTGVRVDSYHSTWFEAHEDFLLCLGIKRETD